MKPEEIQNIAEIIMENIILKRDLEAAQVFIKALTSRLAAREFGEVGEKSVFKKSFRQLRRDR
jgi:hypothetical protein